MVWAQSAVSWQIRVEGRQPARVGDTLNLVMEATIRAPYHLYSSRVPAREANLPTTFTPLRQVGLQFVGPLLEEGHLHTVYDSIFETEVYYYEGQVRFRQRVVITANPAQGEGLLRYQYCDEEQCFTEKLEVPIQVAVESSASSKGSTSGQGAEENRLPSGRSLSQVSDSARAEAPQGGFSSAPSQRSLASEVSTVSESGGQSAIADSSREPLVWVFLKAFLFGLAAVLTPCTFPMIPLTVSYFTKASEGRKGFPFLALWYAASILIIFWVLGLVLTLLFGASAAYNVATNPWLNLVFFLILLLFGLSFLGAFEITLPASWGTATSRYASPRSLGGVFFMALTLVLVSFSCIGPLVGTLMIDMVGGEVWEPLVGMTGFGLAFALPFGALVAMPRLLQRLPRSGEWLETFKVTLGFLELALALKFLSNADLVWHLGLLDREVYLVLWITLFLFLALYLLGKLPLKGAPSGPIGVGRLLLSMGSFALALYFFTGLWGAPLKAFSGLLPPIHDEMGVRLVGGGSFSNGTPSQATCLYPPTRRYADKLRKYTPPDFCAFYDLDEARQYAAAVGKPLLIDFTGHTCVNCRQVESSVWSQPPIKKLIQEQFVLVSLFVDDATPLPEPETTPEGERLYTLGDKWLYLQKARYGVQAQPYYVITDSTLKPLVSPMGFTLDVLRYQAFLEGGLRRFEEGYASLRKL